MAVTMRAISARLLLVTTSTIRAPSPDRPSSTSRRLVGFSRRVTRPATSSRSIIRSAVEELTSSSSARLFRLISPRLSRTTSVRNCVTVTVSSTSASDRADTPTSTRAAGVGVDEFVTAVLTASRVLVGVSARSLAEVEETVTVTQFRTLVVLDSRGEINLNSLAEELDVNSSTALRMIDRLLVAGLVTRRENPTNRREVLLGLSGEGARIVDVVTKSRRVEIARIVTAMPSERRSELIAALHAFADAAGEPQPLPAVNWAGGRRGTAGMAVRPGRRTRSRTDDEAGQPRGDGRQCRAPDPPVRVAARGD